MFGLVGFILGSVLGSFAKVLSDRSLKGKSFSGRSYCPYCKKILNWYDLLPVFSYIALVGKCRHCKHKIPLEYLLVEVLMGCLVGFLFWQSSANFQTLVANFESIFNFQFLIFVSDLAFKTFFIVVLVVFFLTDFKKMFIPDRIVLPSIVISVIYLLSITLYKVVYLYYSLLKSPIGQKLLPPYTNYFQRHAIITAQPLFTAILCALLVGGFFMALIIITKGKGMGGGDVKLGVLMGLGLGFPGSLLALTLAFLTGSVISLMLVAFRKKDFGSHIAFGPFLVLGSLITLFWGPQILSWYIGLKP